MNEKTLEGEGIAVPHWSAKAWDDIAGQVLESGETGKVFPPEWKLKHLRDSLFAFPLVVGGDRYGYVFWLPAHNSEVLKGMRHLKAFEKELDDEIGKNLDLQNRVRELEDEIAILRSQAQAPHVPQPPAQPLAQPPILSILESSDKPYSKGHIAYYGRAEGKPWNELGPNALNNAKSYSKTNGLSWPPVS